MSSPRPDSPPRAGSMPSGNPPPEMPARGSSALSSPPLTVSQLVEVDDSPVSQLAESSPIAPSTTPRTNTPPHQASWLSPAAVNHILDSHTATSPAEPSSPAKEIFGNSNTPTMAELYDSSPPCSPRPTEHVWQYRTPSQMPEPAAIAGMQLPPQPIPQADPNESALLRRLIDERSRFEWSAEQTARWERENPRDILRSLAVALCEMDEGEFGEELVRMKDEEVEEACLRRLIEGKGLSQPDIDDWIRDNPGVGLRTLAMMVADMTNGGIQVELAGMRREAGEGQESEGAAEGGEGRGETRLGIAEGGEREEAVEEDAAEEEGHEWDNKVAGGDTDSSPSSEEKGEKSVDQEAGDVDDETPIPTKRKSKDEEVAKEVQLEEYNATAQHSSQGPEPEAQNADDRAEGDNRPGSGFGEERFMSLDGAGDSKELKEPEPEPEPEEFVDGNEIPDEEFSEQAKQPTETPEMVKCDETLANAVQEQSYSEDEADAIASETLLRLLGTSKDEQLALERSLRNGTQEEVVQAPDGPVAATSRNGRLAHVSGQPQPMRAERRAARRAAAGQVTGRTNTSSPTPFQIVPRRGAPSQRGYSKPTRFPKKFENDVERSPAISLPSHKGAFRGRVQGTQGGHRGGKGSPRSTRVGDRPVRGDGQTDREFLGPRGGFNQGDMSQKGGKRGVKGNRG